ncbi:hypothetical protein C8Q74DRAFT_1363716 [Fomes fomentarius]|nr:hypothetical protein C8Q74DRAFT_1363716 [Fomes fomentarius]
MDDHPVGRKPIQRAVNHVDFDERQSSAEDPRGLHPREPPNKHLKRPAKLSHLAPRKRRKLTVSNSLLTSRRINVDEAIKRLDPNADGPYCAFDKLEWAWDLGYHTLNVDTRWNIQLLCPELHRHFDHTKHGKHDGWFWLPDSDDAATLVTMYEYYVGCTLAQPAPAQYPNVPRNPATFYEGKGSFKYRLIPFPAMKSAWPVRQLGDTSSQFTKDSPVTQYYYPFAEMPPVSLHIPYHFVICDTGRKLNGIYGSNFRDITPIMQDFPHLLDFRTLVAVRGIYDAWMKAVPDPAWIKPHTTEGQSRVRGPHIHHDVGSGDPSSSNHGGNEGGGQGASNQNSVDQVSGQWDTGGTPVGHRASAQSSLAPEDSDTCRDAQGSGSEKSCEEEAVEDEEDEDDEGEEDPEWEAWVQAWLEDVWEATHGGASSPSRSQETLVGVSTD